MSKFFNLVAINFPTPCTSDTGDVNRFLIDDVDFLVLAPAIDFVEVE